MEGARFRKLGGFFHEVFGTRVHKVGLRGGFTCPNRDGTVGTGGCSFCNPASSLPLGFRQDMTITEQLEEGCAYVARRHGVTSFIAYFQDYTVTYGDPDLLRGMLLETLAFPGIVGAALCTRPDCLAEPVLDRLADLARDHFLWVEVGVQSSEDALLLRAGRGHDAACATDAFSRLHDRGLLTAAHMILGLPGSDSGSVEADATFIRRTGTAGLKLQNLHVVSGTRLEEEYRRGDLEPMTLEGYAGRVVEFLERTDPGVVIQRVSGEAPRALTVAPDWSVNKLAVVNAVHRLLEERDGWQGRLLGFPRDALDAPPAALSALRGSLARIARKRIPG